MSDRVEREVTNGPTIEPQVVANLYASYMSVAFAGMKGDSMDDNVDTFACAANPIGFGLVVGRTAPFVLTIQPGGTAPVGISLHDHIIASRGGYAQYDAVSVMNRGKVWCQCSAATNVEDGTYVRFDPATGQVNTTGTILSNAVFRSKAISVYDITYTTTTLIALVEMHYGLAINTGTIT